MPFTFDGCYVPSYLDLKGIDKSIKDVDSHFFNDAAIHVGYVAAIHYPGDPDFTDLKYVSYDVIALTSMGAGAMADAPYRGVRWAGGLMGSANDLSRPRLNAPKGWSAGKPFTEEMKSQASKVVFACANGKTEAAYILGVIDHPFNEVPDSKEYGHYYAQSFNGVNTLIDKDGQYSLIFTGAILDPDSNAYKTAPEATTGTTILLDKEGSLLLDNVKGESLKLNKTDKAIQIKARSMSTVVSDKDHTTQVPNGKVYFLAGQNAVFNGKKIYIGAETTTEPLVLGTQLTIFVQNLLNAFLMKPFIGVLGNMPIMLHPDVRKDLMGLMPYGTPASRFLSKKGFVE